MLPGYAAPPLMRMNLRVRKLQENKKRCVHFGAVEPMFAGFLLDGDGQEP
jgi:hypothetical protein